MKIFKYIYYSLDKEKTGFLLASSKAQALLKLENKDIISINEIGFFNNKLNELESIFWQLGFGLNSGLNLICVLESIRSSLYYKEHINLLDSIISRLNGGESISVALREHVKVCGNLVVALFEIGEKSGKLNEMCELCAREIKQKNEFIESVRKALIYPCVLLISCFVAFIILSIYVIPEFAQIYSELDSALPTSTQYVIFITNIMNEYFTQIILFFISLISILIVLLSKKIIKDRILLSTPIINKIILDYELYRYFLALYYFLSSKVSFLESIKICNSLINNIFLRQKFDIIEVYLNSGHPLSYAFERIDVDIANIALLKSGEQGGVFDKSLQLNYEFYKKRYKQSLQNISILVEPLVTIFMGLFITWLAFSVVSPMWQLLEIAI